MLGASGIYIKQHLGDFHLADIERIAEAAVRQHEKEGCRFDPDWREALRAGLLEALPDLVGGILEAKECFCPERGIGIEKAA